MDISRKLQVLVIPGFQRAVRGRTMSDDLFSERWYDAVAVNFGEEPCLMIYGVNHQNLPEPYL